MNSANLADRRTSPKAMNSPTGTACYVVLGATGDIGSALSRRLVENGHRVWLGGRDPQRREELARELASGASAVDALQPGTIGECLEAAAAEFGRIDGVANCIGSFHLRPAHATTDDEWNETLRVNLGSAFETVRAAARWMRPIGGSIVLVSSVAATIGLANHEAIAAAKGGVAGLTLSAAATYAPQKIRVNAVAPGLVRSRMTRALWESESAAAISVGLHAIGRLGEPNDIARLIEWLLLPENDWITGQIIGIDGGLGRVLPRARVRT